MRHSFVTRGNHAFSRDRIHSVSIRYKTITKAINKAFWNSASETAHSRYVGSYGRGTAIPDSDLDILVELPDAQWDRFISCNGNGPSYLLQVVKNAVGETYSRTNRSGDGQVVVVNFSDGMKFEILPAFLNGEVQPKLWKGVYLYPDTHDGGCWFSTNPKAEQAAMRAKNEESNGLLFDTCRHMRYIRQQNYSSYHLSGILIDSFAYVAIQDWHWLRSGECSSGQPTGTYERVLLDYYNRQTPQMQSSLSAIPAPGSGDPVNVDDWEILGKVLNQMV